MASTSDLDFPVGDYPAPSPHELFAWTGSDDGGTERTGVQLGVGALFHSVPLESGKRGLGQLISSTITRRLAPAALESMPEDDGKWTHGLGVGVTVPDNVRVPHEVGEVPSSSRDGDSDGHVDGDSSRLVPRENHMGQAGPARAHGDAGATHQILKAWRKAEGVRAAMSRCWGWI